MSPTPLSSLKRKKFYIKRLFLAQVTEELSGDSINKRQLLTYVLQAFKCYQHLQPGIWSESGFNLCKLLNFTDKDDIVNESQMLLFTIQTLLAEPRRGIKWLEKVRYDCDSMSLLCISQLQLLTFPPGDHRGFAHSFCSALWSFAYNFPISNKNLQCIFIFGRCFQEAIKNGWKNTLFVYNTCFCLLEELY